MPYLFLFLLSLVFIGCSQKYYKSNVQISENEYLFYKNGCEKKYQKYSEEHDRGGLYAIGEKRHHDEYIRECMEVINDVFLENKQDNNQLKTKESSEFNLFKVENNLLKISK